MAEVPKVVIDARMVKPIPSGFGAYVSRLAEGLQAVEEESELLYEPIFLVAADSPKANFQSFGTVTLEAPFLNPAELTQVPRALKKIGAKAFHSPTFASFLGLPCPWAVTIHDLNHLTWGGLRERLYYRLLLRPFAKKAKAVLTVSEFSKKEIVRWLEIPEPRVQVAANAISPAFLEPLPREVKLGVLERYGLEDGKFFVCISNSKPHKNFAMLLRAYAAARARRDFGEEFWPLATTVDLGGQSSGPGFASGPAMVGSATASSAGNGNSRIKILHEVRELEARALLQSAGAVVFPSLYEGFGLPPVEAVCSGSTLLVSDIAPHREGLQDLGLGEVTWLDPKDENTWTEALLRAERGEVPKPTVEGRSRVAARYNVSALGRGMDQVYRRMLGLPS